MNKMKVAVIGYGSFGRFAAQNLSRFFEVYVIDRQLPVDCDYSPLGYDEVGSMDCVVLAVPLGAYTAVIEAIKPSLRPDTLVVDVCSVKTESREAVLAGLPDHKNILICHPLFGPQSAASGLEGHDMVVTDTIGDIAEKSVTFFRDTLNLQVHTMSAEEHDRAMAYIHVLTFFVARGLNMMKRPDIAFQTPSYNLIQALVDFDRTHTEELFLTIQKGNPYAGEVRAELVRTFGELEESLMKKRER